jgi:hypothetical protein
VTRLNYLANCVVGCRVECYEDCVLCSKDDAGYVKGYFEAPSNPLDSEPQGDACALEQGPYHYKERSDGPLVTVEPQSVGALKPRSLKPLT